MNEALAASGWVVIRAWEHELATQVADRVQAALKLSDSGRK